jgi:hypothetical protein
MKPWQAPLNKAPIEGGKEEQRQRTPSWSQKGWSPTGKGMILLVRTSADAGPGTALFFLYGHDMAVQQPADN